VIGTRAKDEVDELLDHSRPETRKWSGAMSHTLFGNLNGVYTLDCDDIPSEDEIRDALRIQVMRDCRRSGKRDRDTVLTAWHGGWTREGVGIFSADILRTSRDKRTRHLGRACVNVRTPGTPDREPGTEWPVEPTGVRTASHVQKRDPRHSDQMSPSFERNRVTHLGVGKTMR
jgi:hypothetical protein